MGGRCDTALCGILVISISSGSKRLFWKKFLTHLLYRVCFLFVFYFSPVRYEFVGHTFYFTKIGWATKTRLVILLKIVNLLISYTFDCTCIPIYLAIR